jgi:thioredoxin reductase (NADPH)
MAVDLAIIGTGPAGIAAGLLAGRFDYETILFERSSPGGELENRLSITTYPGFPDGIAGPELRDRFVNHIRGLGLELELSEVINLTPGERLAVSSRDESYECNAVVIATGARSRPLKCPGASKFEGMGVFYCAKWDGPFYTDKTVAVYGGGERAIGDSLYLSEMASEVVIIEEGGELSVPTMLRERVMEAPNIEIRRHTTIAKVVGDDVVSGLVLSEQESPDTCHRSVDGLLVRNGLVPNTDFLEDVIERNDSGELLVDASLETTVPGVFAAGAVREGSPHYVASAVGDGMTAFHGTRKYIR